MTISMMFILLYCVTGLSQSENIHDVCLLYCVTGLSQSDNIHDVHLSIVLQD